MSGPRSAQSQATLRDPLHSTLCFYIGSSISVFQSAFHYIQDAISALSAVEAMGRGEQLLHFHCSPAQSGQVLDRTWLLAGMLRPLGKTQIQESALVWEKILHMGQREKC